MSDPGTAATKCLSIRLGDAQSAGYKSIDEIVWEDIPKFAVLTGLNGSGKTQFLQALAYKISGTIHQNYHELNELRLEQAGDTVGRDEVAYFPSAANAFRNEYTSAGRLPQLKQQFLQRVGQQSQHDIEARILGERIRKKFGIKLEYNATQQEADKLPDDFLYMLEYTEVSASLSHVFIAYQLRKAEKLLDKQSEEKITAELGRAPWDFVNEALAAAEFEYRIVPPPNNLCKEYQIVVKNLDSDVPIILDDLSSGEKTIFRKILWFYNSKHNDTFPKLFLLDEPDAHLHPSMIRQFIDVLKNVLVDQYNVRVILTTHSPSTVAMVPEDSLFVMSRYQPRIRRPASKAEAIGLLTSGLVIVSPGTRFVLVEDEEDVTFYGAVRDILVDQGPSRDPKALKPAPSLIFMPASTRKGKDKTAGGKNVVERWTEKFDTPPLREMFRGIIDRDEGNEGKNRLYAIGRYSIENYWLDPILVFGVLTEERRAPSLHGIDIAAGDEHLLRILPSYKIKMIVDHIGNEVLPKMGILTEEEKLNQKVEFTNGEIVQYPTWMLTRRGHDLMPIYQLVFGQALITPPRLEKMFRRIRMVPIELAEMMSQIQMD